jgi:hypothetical protein
MTRHRSFFLQAIAIILVLGSAGAQAQVGKAVSRIEDGKWSSAEQILRKEISKDSLNVEARFWLGKYFFLSSNPQRNLDSARLHVVSSTRIFSSLPERQTERLVKSGIDSVAMGRLKKAIDSTAFADAKHLNTINSYETFVQKFPDAAEVSMAAELRNEVAFLDALRVNAATAFQAYLQNYPESRRSPEARERYERLVFQEITRDGKLASYKRFVSLYPQSAYCSEAEKKIFEVSTASGLADSYKQFLSEYPLSAYVARASNILYYLLDPHERVNLKSDSLNRLAAVTRGYWVPFFKNGKYGFMDEDGVETMSPRFASIDSAYRCGNIREDVLLTSDGLFSRAGHKLLSTNPRAVTSLGLGFLLVETGDCKTLIHKSGFQIGPDCITNAKIVSNQFVAVKTGKGWAIHTLGGLPLKLQEYEDVTFEDKIIILTRLGKQLLVRTDDLAAVADGALLSDSLVFDEIRAWGEGNLLVRNGALEGVLNQQLEFIIPLDRQTLNKTTSGFVRSKDGQRRVVGASDEVESSTFEQVLDYGAWLVLVNNNKSTLYLVSNRSIAGRGLDSVWMRNKIPFGEKNDSLYVFGTTGKAAVFDSKALPSFIKSRDTVVYYWIQDKKLKTVFDANRSKKLFSLEFEDIESIGDGKFIVKQKNKKGQVKLGLTGLDGKPILPAEYDAIIPNKNVMSLLKDKQFGLYDISRQRLIRTSYERNVVPYSNRLLIAYRGGYGIINESELAITPFEFDEIRYWNDTSAWVRKNLTWSIYDLKSNTNRLTRIRNFEILRDSEEEKIVRVQQDNHFGVVSNVHGIIIPATFSDVVNVGSADKPLYFTDKRVEEAEIDVVIYYDHRGKLIRKQVYESDEYEKIYCEEGQ